MAASGNTTTGIEHQLRNISSASTILVEPVVGPQFEGKFHLYDSTSKCICLYATRIGNSFTDLRLLKISGLKKVTSLTTATIASGSKPTQLQSAKSTVKKATVGGSATPSRRESRPGTPDSPRPPATSVIAPSKDELPEDARLLLAGLGKHLSVRTKGKSIFAKLASTEAKIDPPYTKAEGSGDEMLRIRRILESERSVLPKKGKKKDAKVPALGG